MARPAKLTDEMVIASLAERPGSSAAELAVALCVGHSTAAKRLAALEPTGAVRRTEGGRAAGVRTADRWHASFIPVGGPPDEMPLGAERGAAEHLTVAGPPGRLGRGALVAMVADYLANRPGGALGPTGVAKALDRSQGAVSNALAALAERGEVVLVSEHPRRYRIARQTKPG